MLNNEILYEFIDHKQKLVEINLNEHNTKDFYKCLNGTCLHKKIISIDDTIKINTKTYNFEKVKLDKFIKVCLITLNIISPINDILYFKTLINNDNENELLLNKKIMNEINNKS